jgi:hypothetical protein
LSALTDIERVLDSAARRLLAERDSDPLATPTRSDNGSLDSGDDDTPALVKGEVVPVVRKPQQDRTLEAA